MKTEDQHTIRSTGWLLVQRAVVVIGALLFALIMPRMMGPVTYGKYALLNYFAIWLTLLGTMGSTYVILRYTPQFALKGTGPDVQNFLGALCSFRLVSGGFAALLCLAACRLWLPEIPPAAVILLAAVVFLRPQARLFFGILLAVNRPARWGMTHVLRGWGSLLFVPPLYLLAGLGGACAGLLLCEVFLLAIGVCWAGRYVRKPVWRWRHITPYLGFGLTFFWTDLLSTGSAASGTIMVRMFTGNYSEVGFFGLAQAIFGLLLLSVLLLVTSAAPRLNALRIRGDTAGIKRQAERLLEILSAVSMLLFLAALLLGHHFVPPVLGAQYRPVAVNLVVMMAALVPLVLCSVGRVLCMVCERPGIAFSAECLRLALYWSIGCLLIPRLHSVGASIATTAGSVVMATWLTVRTRREIPYRLGNWLRIVLLGVLFMPLAFLAGNVVWAVGLFVLTGVSYTGALFALRILSWAELREVWDVLRSGAPASKQEGML